MDLEGFLKKAEIGEEFDVRVLLMQIPERMRPYFKDLSDRLGTEGMLYLMACANFYDNPQRALDLITQSFPKVGMGRVNFQTFYNLQKRGYRKRKANKIGSDPELIVYAIEGLCPESPERRNGKKIRADRNY